MERVLAREQASSPYLSYLCLINNLLVESHAFADATVFSYAQAIPFDWTIQVKDT